MRGPETNHDAATTALGALAWVVSEPPRAERFLSLTGIDPADLRSRAGDPALLVQLLAHLEAYEPDLIACAEALGLTPADLVAARTRLENP